MPWQTPALVQTSLNVLASLSLHAAPRLVESEQKATQQVCALHVEPGVQAVESRRAWLVPHTTPVLEHVAGMPWQTPADVQTSLMVATLLSLQDLPRLVETWQNGTPWHTPLEVHTSLNVLALLSSHAAPRLVESEQKATQQVCALHVKPGVQAVESRRAWLVPHTTPVLEHVAGTPWQTPADVQTSLMVATLLSLHDLPTLVDTAAH
jgi:hypothetical protein